MKNLSDYLVTDPQVIWLIALIGAVCVIGLVDFIKCFIKDKNAVKFIVLFVSLYIAIVLSPLVPPIVATILILFHLVLSLSTIARNAIVDGLPSLTSKIMGGNSNRQ
jgi:hypothetical protein